MNRQTLLSDEATIRINQSLLPLKPAKVILFGSRASGTASAESDIDLAVVLPSQRISQTFRERADNHARVRSALASLNEEFALDLLVFTQGEWQQLIDLGSSFPTEILRQGISIG